MLRSAAAAIAAYPGSYYIIVLLLVGSIQIANCIAYFYGGPWTLAVLPNYTHALSLTIGSVFLFRAIQLLVSLLWARVFKSAESPQAYTMSRQDLPFVTVQIPVRNEPVSVAKVAIDAAFAMEYPADRLEIQILDNSDSEEFWLPIERYLNAKLKEQPVCAVYPSSTFLHRDGTEGFKAGNLNLGMESAQGSIFMVLDADSSVPPGTLLSALPYFEDAGLGFVQLRIDPANEDESVVTRAAAVTIRARYMTMRVRDAQGVIQFDGHNGLIRREALEAVGGWAEDVSEDLSTSVRMVLAGFSARFADLPSGELLPTRFQELYKQRKRWALGTVLFLKQEGVSILKSKHLRWYQKLDLFYASLNILVEALAWVAVFTFAPLPLTTFLEIIFVFSILPTVLSGKLGFVGSLRRQLAVIFVISAILPALVEGVLKALFGVTSQFTVTQKAAVNRLNFPDLLSLYRLGVCAAVFFFSVTISQSDGFFAYIDSYLPGAVIMGAAILAPFVLNYTGRKSASLTIAD